MTAPNTPGPANPGTDAETLRARIEECVRLLKATRHLDPEAQKALAELLREMAQDLHPDDDPEHAGHLVASSAALIQALHDQQDAGFIASARTRLEEATVRAQAEAPVVTGFVRRLIDALAGIGV
ncbi:MAG: DUF4404 family protein [Isosphaeraceae bacterium]